MERLKVCPLSELKEGQNRVIQRGGDYIAVLLRDGKPVAVNDTCPHMGGSLATGWITDEGTVVCPWHGWEFRLCDGAGVWPPGINIKTYAVEVQDGDIYVVFNEEQQDNGEQSAD